MTQIKELQQIRVAIREIKKKEDSCNNKFCITRIRHTKWNRKRSGQWPKEGWEEREKKMLGVGKNGW